MRRAGPSHLTAVVFPAARQRSTKRGGQGMPITSRAILVVGLLLFCAPGSRGQSTFKAGFADRDITPDIGMEHPGGYGKAYHRNKHDACKVRAAVFDDGKNKVAIVGIDALIIRRPQVVAARKAITEKTGIPPTAILIGASHTHAGGPTGMVLPGAYDDAPEMIRQLAYEKSSAADPKYLPKVEQAIIDAVSDAHDRRTALNAAAGIGSVPNVSFNRRFIMKDGSTKTHPGQGNPDIVEPAGPIDPQVSVLGAWDKDGKLVGCVVNFACHATTGPGGISADYVFYVEKVIRGFWGDNVTVVFVNGMSGDVTQVDNRNPYQIKQGGEPSAELVGGSVGAEALKTLLAIRPSAGALVPVLAETKTLKIPHRAPSAQHVAEAMAILQKGTPPKNVDATDWIFAKETVMVDWKIKKEPIADVEVMAVQVGPVVFLSSPAEYFCQFGLDLKAASKFPVTMPVSLANDCFGYVPTEAAFGPHGGGYETRLSSYSNLEVKSGTKIRDALIEMVGTLTPGEMPKPPALPTFKGKPWTYGNVPPGVD
jgi:hypothetical protein